MRHNREELVERMFRALPEDGFSEVFPGFFLRRSSRKTEPTHYVHEPAFCFVVQGRKRVLLGEEVLRYDPGHFLIFTVDLPVIFQIDEASPAQPYFGFRLDLDPALVASVLLESGMAIKKADTRVKALDVSPVDGDLLDVVVRLVRLIEKSEERNGLVPLIKRELVFRLLAGGQGARLSHLVTSGRDTRQIARAIGHLRAHFTAPLRIEDLARDLGMSVSGFHHHFKSVTAMTPLQFQKQLRLQEARRLLLSEDLDAASAGFRVGYEDPSYFSRDYKKLFGAPPQRDIARLRSNLTLA